IDRGHCAQLAGEFKLFLGEVDRHDIRAHGTRDHDGRKPDTAAAVNCYPFSRPDPTLVDNSAEGGDEAAAKARCRGEVHVLGEGDQVRIGMVDGDIFGVGTPGGKARLELMFAYLMIAGGAYCAAAASDHEGNRNAISRPPAADPAPGSHDHPGELVPRNVGQPYVRVMPHPAVPVAAAKPGRLDLDDNALGGGRGIRHCLDGWRLAELLENDGSHELLRATFNTAGQVERDKP